MFKKMNKVIKVLILSQLIFSGAWGLTSPIFAIFILEDVVENPVQAATVAGFASLTYWGVKSILQIPVSYYLDENHGEEDDFCFLIIGLVLTSFIPFGFMLSTAPWHIYCLQVLQAIAKSMVIPSRSAMFTRHIDEGKEAYEWAMSSTFLGIASGVAGATGGIVASHFGFKTVFILTGIFTFFSALTLFLIKDNISLSDKKVTRVSQFIEDNNNY